MFIESKYAKFKDETGRRINENDDSILIKPKREMYLNIVLDKKESASLIILMSKK